MDKETTTISLRIPRVLNDNLTGVSDELGLKKIDFIRFLLEAGTRLDKERLKHQLKKAYDDNLESGIVSLMERLQPGE